MREPQISWSLVLFGQQLTLGCDPHNIHKYRPRRMQDSAIMVLAIAIFLNRNFSFRIA